MKVARRRPARGAIHALRVATRRALALCDLLGAADCAHGDDSLAKILRRPFDACGRLRDLQLMDRTARAMERRFPQARRFRRYLALRMTKARSAAVRGTRAAHPRRVARQLAERSKHLATLMLRPADLERVVRRIARRLDVVRREATAARQRARTGDPRAIHEARLAYKAERYLTEIVRQLGLVDTEPPLLDLERVQAQFGAFTDCTVLLHGIDAFARRHPRAGAHLAPMRARVAREQARLAERCLAAT